MVCHEIEAGLQREGKGRNGPIHMKLKYEHFTFINNIFFFFFLPFFSVVTILASCMVCTL